VFQWVRVHDIQVITPISIIVKSHDDLPLGHIAPHSEDESAEWLIRNAPSEYENIIRNIADPDFPQLSEKINEWNSRMESDIKRHLRELGYEYPNPDPRINNDERVPEIYHRWQNKFIPEGIQLINQIAPYYNKPEFVYSQAPENGITYSNEQLQDWMDSIYVPYGSFCKEYSVLLEEWNSMMPDVVKAGIELEKTKLNLQMNAALLQEQKRHNLAMESKAKQRSESMQTQQRPQAKKSGLGMRILKGAGKLLAANHRHALAQQAERKKGRRYYCTKCKRLQDFARLGPHYCCGKSMIPK
jgi:hypothetical protein